MANYAMFGVGGAMHIAGTVIGANEADDRRDRMKEIAETPGLDFGDITGSALSDYEGYLPRSAALSGKLGLANQQSIGAMEEAALPGVGAARQKALGRISGLFDEDSAWLRGIQRRGAALGLSSGLRGSQAGQLQTLRLSDQEQMQRTHLGTGLLGSLIGSMRMANTPGAQAFLGPSISEQLNQRANERREKMAYMAAMEGMPTGMEVYSGSLKEVGASFMGSSMGGGMIGGGGMMGGGGAGNGGTSGMAAGSQQSQMMGSYGGGGGGW